jgi:DHA2 family multidrug resistance protein
VARFGEALGASGRGAQDFIAAGAERMAAFTPDPDHARLMAQAMMGKVIGREALTIAFDEVFRIMAWMFVVALVMVPFCRVPKDAAPVSPVESH